MNLSWSSNPENNITGYQVRYGTTSGVYPNTISVGINPSASVSSLVEGNTYFFVVAAVNQFGLQGPDSNEVSYQIPTTVLVPSAGWTVHFADSQESMEYQASNAFDGNPDTIWHTSWSVSPTPPPHEIQINLGATQSISGFRYLPRSGTFMVGNVGQFAFYVSQDGTNWGNPVATGTFANTHELKEVRFTETTARYVRFRGLTDGNGGTYMSIAELSLIQGVTAPPANRAPVAVAKSASTSENSPVQVALSGTDADGDPLTYSLLTNPAKGTLSGTAPNLTYSPQANFVGNDSFTYRVNDGTLNSVAATVSITVAPINHLPVATAKSVSATEDTPLAITLEGSDPDNNSLTFSTVGGTAHGTLSGSAPNLTYTPAANYNGNDQFTFKVNDGSLNSTVAIISITVAAVNDAPVAVAKSASTSENTPVQIALSETDADGDPLTYSLLTNPAKGTLSGTAPNLTYSPQANFVGNDSFTYRVNDGTLNSVAATVSITVAPINHLPVATAKSVSATEDTPLAITLEGSDPDNNSLTFSTVGGTAHGTLSGSAPNLTYTPAANYNGNDQFTFKVNDGSLNSTVAIISITVAAVNDTPVVTSKSLSTVVDAAIPVTLTGTDSDGDPLTFSIVGNPANGNLTGTPPDLTYHPSPGFSGNDQFTFMANDGTGNSGTASISVAVSPKIPTDGISVLARTGWTLKSVDSQELFDAPGNAAFDGNPSTFWHTEWRNGANPVLPHEIQINLGSVVPVSGFRYLPRQDGPSIGNIGNYQFFVSMDGVSWGTPVATGTFANSSGEKQVTFTTKSGRYVRLKALSEVHGFTDTCIAELNVLKGTLINQAPSANIQSISTETDTPVSLVLTGNDPDGNALGFSVVSGPAHGTLTGNAPNLTYIPDPGYIGEDQLTFRSNDGAVYSPKSVVLITVNPVAQVPGNIAPAFPSASFSAASTEDEAFTGSLSATDGNDGDILTFEKISGPDWLIVSPDGGYGGTPLNPNVGINNFVVKVTDQYHASATALLTITVANTNDAPVFKTSPIIYPSGTEKVAYREQTLRSIATDPDAGDTFSYSIISGPEWLSIAESGLLSGTPPQGSAGLNQFTIRATDTAGAFSEGILQIDINPNTLPLPWTLDRVGTGNLAGPALYSAGVFTVGGAGSLDPKSDAANFSWQTLSGDGKIIARIAKLDDTGADTRVGLMIRDSLDPQSRQVFIGMNGNGKLRWLRRTANGEKAIESPAKGSGSDEPWLKLERSDDTIIAYKSKNGEEWVKVGSTKLRLPENCYIGFTVSSGDKDLLNTSKFSRVRVFP